MKKQFDDYYLSQSINLGTIELNYLIIFPLQIPYFPTIQLYLYLLNLLLLIISLVNFCLIFFAAPLKKYLHKLHQQQDYQLIVK